MLGRRWIIPAYAGNTMSALKESVFSQGSSPHTRGTPARFAGCSPSERDHPRIRGEHGKAGCKAKTHAGIIPAYAGDTFGVCSLATTHIGSSPHTRGTRAGIISKRIVKRDHPRIRGEHCRRWRWRWRVNVNGIIPAYAGNTYLQSIIVGSLLGSSPHTRGTPPMSASAELNVRDHPRIRGEHISSNGV